MEMVGFLVYEPALALASLALVQNIAARRPEPLKQAVGSCSPLVWLRHLLQPHSRV